MIEQKIKELSFIDKKFSVFGSSKHQYKFNKVLTEKELNNIENLNNIIIPEDYKDFLIKVGNGGAGRGYGLSEFSINGYNKIEKPFKGTEYLLKKYIQKWLDYDRNSLLYKYNNELSSNFQEPIKNISTIDLFKKAKKLNLDLNQVHFKFPIEDLLLNPLENIHDVYVEVDHSEFTGFIDLFEEGCGHKYVLIVNGIDYGKVIFYGCDGQLSITNMSFLEFYEDWLEKTLLKMRNIQTSLKTEAIEKVIEKEWKNKNFSIHANIYSIINVQPPKEKRNSKEYFKALQKKIDIWNEYDDSSILSKNTSSKIKSTHLLYRFIRRLK